MRSAIAWVVVSGVAMASAWADPGWRMSLDGNGVPVVSLKGAPMLSGSTPFWAQNWKWAGCDWQREVNPEKNAPVVFVGKVPALGVEMRNAVTYPAANIMRCEYAVEFTREMKGVIGGGFDFNLDIASAVFKGKSYEPVIAEDKNSIVWDCGEHGTLQMSFAPPLAALYFERGRKNQIRGYFVPENIKPGKTGFTMTLTLPEGGVRVLSPAERYAPVDTAAWSKDLFAWNKSPIDLSGLNHKPAGTHGSVRAQGEKLLFANGQEARFWGCNLQAYALFNTKDENIPVQAKRIAQLGFNLVRIHHHDSDWTPNVFGGGKAASTRQLDPAMMDKLDRWIKALKDEGVYLWLDLHVGRLFTKADGVELFEDFAKGKPKAEGKGFCYLNTSLQAMMKEFAAQYLGHRNPYTETAYKDDPAVMGILITNENDVTHHFGNIFLADKGFPKHTQLFNEDRKRFCDATGLDFQKTYKTWEPGDSKIYLNDMEHRFNGEMLDCLKGLGVKALVATTNLWGGNASFSLPALADSSIIDTHSYAGAEELSCNPRYRPDYLPSIAFGRLAGKPMAITEWNAEDRPADRTDRFCLPVHTAAVAALQAWNAPMIYGYSQTPLNDQGKLSSWSSYNDPSLAGMMPLTALLFREAHVAPAKKTYCLKLDRHTLFYAPVSAASPAIRTLLEQHRLTVALPAVTELPWLKETIVPPGAELFTDPSKDFIPAGQDFVQSDTGELRRDWEKGIQTINAPKSQVVAGWIGGEALKTADCEFQIVTPKAVAAVQSLDGAPIVSSARLFVTLCARVVALGANGAAPFGSEPVTGQLRINAPEGLKLFPLKPDGGKGDRMPAAFADGTYTITFGAPMLSHWFVMEK